jgi:hypothetical protein
LGTQASRGQEVKVKLTGIKLGNGYELDKHGKKIAKIPNFGLSVSQKIQRRKSKRARVVRRNPT